MALRLVLAMAAATALLAVPVSTQAASAGFCAFGVCAGVEAGAPPGFVFVRICANVSGVGCQFHVVPHMQPVGLPPGVACQSLVVPPGTGIPDGGTVVNVCV